MDEIKLAHVSTEILPNEITLGLLSFLSSLVHHLDPSLSSAFSSLRISLLILKSGTAQPLIPCSQRGFPSHAHGGTPHRTPGHTQSHLTCPSTEGAVGGLLYSSLLFAFCHMTLLAPANERCVSQVQGSQGPGVQGSRGPSDQDSICQRTSSPL